MTRENIIFLFKQCLLTSYLLEWKQINSVLKITVYK